MAAVKCKKCGAPIEIDPGQKFAKCQYCDSQVFIDKSGVGFFYILPFFIDYNNALGIFKRWTANPMTAKDLETMAKVVQFKKQYFPVYMFKRDIGGMEKVIVEPAKSTTLPGMHTLKVPAGDIKIFDQRYNVGDAEVIQPDIDMISYLNRLPGQSKEQALVYFPIWNVVYDYKGTKYPLVIDGSSGEVMATYYPPREAAPYYLAAGIGFVLFLIEGFFIDSWGGIGALITLPIIFGITYYVAKKL